MSYLIAKIDADTGENEPTFDAKVDTKWQILPNVANVRTDLPNTKRGAPQRRRGLPRAASRPAASATPWASKKAFFENFANFWRARSRLYQNEILQQNMRLAAFFKLYKICILLHRCNLKIFAKNRFEILRISQNF